jgi:hypothetical protein
MKKRITKGLIRGGILISLSLYACDQRGVEKENLNNNGTGTDQDATQISPDTLSPETVDTLLNSEKERKSVRIDSVLSQP